VLESVAEKLALLRARAPASAFAHAVADVRVSKLGREVELRGADADADDAAGGIVHVDPRQQRGRLDALVRAPWLVLGATPGGLYNAQKYRGLGGNDVPWDDRPFALVVLDEASQVNVPEALLATAFVAADGQALVVGDPRQLPPIVAAAWNEEARRTVVDSEAYRSIFDFLHARRFPRVGLDRSFRLHRRLAAFLEEVIYRQDGIAFHSTRDDTFPPVQTGDPFVDAVLDPAYPVVVVEHAEAQSQQSNEVEADLITPIVAACREALRRDGATGLGVVVPHRAQRALLRARFPALDATNSVDTVERFQGGERDVIVVSATVSDPDYILGEADFLLNANRLNVALSRPKRKLIVLAGASLFRVLAADADVFEQAALWKRLRYTFCSVPLWSGRRARTAVSVFGCGAGADPPSGDPGVPHWARPPEARRAGTAAAPLAVALPALPAGPPPSAPAPDASPPRRPAAPGTTRQKETFL
jgi:hypothetical protein